eukprot:s720_g11.t1
MNEEVLSKLSEVLAQQHTSSTNLELLQNQLREWRHSVDALLGIHSQTSGAPRGPLQQQAAPATSKTRASAQVQFRAPAIARAFGSDADSDLIMDSVMLNETAARKMGPIEAVMELPSPIDSDGVGHRRSLSSQSLLQPRKSVVQNLPTGPLRKLVSEVLHDAEVTTQKPSRIEAFRQSVAAIVNSSLFEFVAGILILLNLIFIGIEAQVSLQTGEVYAENFWPGGVERIFLVLYAIEATLRVTGLGCAAFKDLWFLMDLTLIMIGALALEIVPRVAGPGTEAESFYSVLVVRGFRLFRLVRALRMLRHFKLIWRLVYGMLAAGQTIISTTALIAIFLFIFSCVAVELISKDRNLTESEPTRDIVRDYFSGLNGTFLTLIQFVTLDSIAEVYYPLIMNKPWLTFYFMPLLIFLSVGLMNLVTAALVENAMETAAHEAEEERQKLKRRVQSALPSLIEIFHELDKDRSGLLTREEVENVPLSVLPPRVLDTIYADSMADIFDYLDVDGTKQLTQIEFVEGLLNLRLMDTSISTLQSLKLLQLIRSVVGQVETEMSTLRREMQKLRAFMTTISM